MGFLNKLFHGFYYVVDSGTLREYLEQELKFTLDNRLEACAHFNIFLNNEKHEVQIWNYAASQWEEEKGLVIYFDDAELSSIDELFEMKLNNLPQYFKIELIDSDNVFLNNYKSNHPELNEEDY